MWNWYDWYSADSEVVLASKWASNSDFVLEDLEDALEHLAEVLEETQDKESDAAIQARHRVEDIFQDYSPS